MCICCQYDCVFVCLCSEEGCGCSVKSKVSFDITLLQLQFLHLNLHQHSCLLCFFFHFTFGMVFICSNICVRKEVVILDHTFLDGWVKMKIKLQKAELLSLTYRDTKWCEGTFKVCLLAGLNSKRWKEQACSCLAHGLDVN